MKIEIKPLGYKDTTLSNFIQGNDVFFVRIK